MGIKYEGGVTWQGDETIVGRLTRDVVALAGLDLTADRLNVAINWTYHHIGQELNEIFANAGAQRWNANWADFGKWASLQVGTSFDDRMRVGPSNGSMTVADRAKRLFFGSKGIATRLVGLSLAEVNRGVFSEVGYSLALFADAFGENPYRSLDIDEIVDLVMRQPLPPGKLWSRGDYKHLLGAALESYHEALKTDDERLRSEKILLANLLFTEFEQRRAQKYLEVTAVSMAHAYERALYRWATPGVITKIPGIRGRYERLRQFGIKGKAISRWNDFDRFVSRWVTKILGTVTLGRQGGVSLSMTEGIEDPEGVPPPFGLERGAIQDRTLIAKLDEYDEPWAGAGPDSERREGTTAVVHWADLHQRMRFIAAMMRTHQFFPPLGDAPYVGDTARDELHRDDEAERTGAMLDFTVRELEPVAEYRYGAGRGSRPERDRSGQANRILVLAGLGGLDLGVDRDELIGRLPDVWLDEALTELRGVSTVMTIRKGKEEAFTVDNPIVDDELDHALRSYYDKYPNKVDLNCNEPHTVYSRFKEVAVDPECGPVWRVLMDQPRPDWLTDDLITAGQRFYEDNRAPLMAGLLLASLPTSYSIKDGVEVLYRVSTLGTNPGQRIMFTAAAMDSWMRGRFWEPGTKSRSILNNVRLLHAIVRFHIRPDPDPFNLRDSARPLRPQDPYPKMIDERPWDLRWGTPVNQEDLLGTALDFSVAALEGARRLGFEFDDANGLDAYVGLWCGVGTFMGLRPDLALSPFAEVQRPLNYEEARLLALQIISRHFGPSRAGMYLGTLLLDELEWLTPGPASLARALLRTGSSAAVADAIGIPDAGLPEGILNFMRQRKINPGPTINRIGSKAISWTISSELKHQQSMGNRPVWMTDGPKMPHELSDAEMAAMAP